MKDYDNIFTMVKKTLSEILEKTGQVYETINGVKYLPYKLMWGSGFTDHQLASKRVDLHRAIRRGLLDKKVVNKKVYLTVTKLGQELLEKTNQSEELTILETPVKEKWDGLYRIVFFDIPESRRFARDSLRQALRAVGAVCWQRSVWVTKSNITSKINELIKAKGLQEHLAIVETSRLFNENLEKS